MNAPKVILMLDSAQFEDPFDCPNLGDDRHFTIPALEDGEDPNDDPVWSQLGPEIIGTYETTYRYFFVFDRSCTYDEQIEAAKRHMTKQSG